MLLHFPRGYVFLLVVFEKLMVENSSYTHFRIALGLQNPVGRGIHGRMLRDRMFGSFASDSHPSNFLPAGIKHLNAILCDYNWQLIYLSL